MKKWLIPTAALTAVVVAAIGTFAIAGGFDDDDDDGGARAQVVGDAAEEGDLPGGDEAKCAADATDCNDPNHATDGDALGMCAPGVDDCVDMVVDGGGAAGVCLEGTVDCVDTPGIDGGDCGPDNTVACEARLIEILFADMAQTAPGQEVTIMSAESTEWPDASLGNPEEGMAYAEVITPGFKFVLEAGGQTFEYHTDLQGTFTVVD